MNKTINNTISKSIIKHIIVKEHIGQLSKKASNKILGRTMTAGIKGLADNVSNYINKETALFLASTSIFAYISYWDEQHDACRELKTSSMLEL